MGRLPRLAVLVVLLLVVVPVFVATDASRRLADLESAEIVHCDRARRRVLAAVLSEVWILGEDGRTLGHLLEADGGRARLEGVSSLATDGDGGIWVVEYTRRRIRRFHPDGRFDAVVLDDPAAFSYRAVVLPLADDRFVLGAVRESRLRLYDRDGQVLREREARYPNDLLAVPGGVAVLETGTGKVLAFDSELEPMEVPAAVADPPHDVSDLRDSMYEIDVDDSGALYFSSCPNETRCKIFRRRPADPATDGATSVEYVAANRWLADYDERDPSYSFCATSGGKVLSASRTVGAILEFAGALTAQVPSGLTWDMLRTGTSANGVRVGVFGDAGFRAWVDAGRARRAALKDRAGLARSGLGLVLALLMAAYTLDRVFGRQGGLTATVRRALEVAGRVLWPDRRAIAIWALPALPVLGLAALIAAGLARLGLVSAVETLVLAIWTSLWIKRLVSPIRLAPRRRADTARRAFGLYLGDGGRQPLPASHRPAPEIASFAAPATAVRDAVRGEKVDVLLERAVSDDPFELLEIVEGGLWVVAYGAVPSGSREAGAGRLVWYPCQLSGKPRGPIRVAPCRPVMASLASSGDTLDLPGGRLTGLAGEVVARLSASPDLGSVAELCEECGAEVTDDTSRRCDHYRDRGRLALLLAVLLPGLGHLVQRRFQRGRWLAIAAVLLVSRMLYLAVPDLLGTDLFHPTDYLVSAVLYALVWWISFKEVREEVPRRRARGPHEGDDERRSSSAERVE